MRLDAYALTLAIGGRTLVHNLSLSFDAGQTWAVLGANGSGKTTLLHTLAGIVAPAAGNVSINGRNLTDMPARERARLIGVLFQDADDAFPSTVLETVLTARHPHLNRFEFPGTQDIARAHAALKDVELDEFGERWTSTLSGGERRRVELATVLAQEAPILLLDEPTNHLDLRHQTKLLQQLRDRAQLRVLVLHDVNLARRFCTHALLLFGDGSHENGPIAEVLTRANLERLYGCPIRELRDADTTFYLPAD
jgi:iron complex transport system ATP-binding protein